MPLPVENQPWPPAAWEPIYRDIEVKDAWYANDVDALAALYSQATSQAAGTSIWGQVRRFFTGSPTPTATAQRPIKMHVPVASEVCRMSASILFGEMPAVTFQDDHDSDDKAASTSEQAAHTGVEKPADSYAEANARVKELLDDDAHTVLLQAAEWASAHGGSFLKVAWAKTVVADRPFIQAVAAESAVPEFSFGRLVAVTFWTPLAPIAGMKYRLLERHEAGVIEFGLYESGDNDLGQRVDLAAHPATVALAGLVDENAQIATGRALLTAVYLPNLRPNRRWRHDPVGQYLGRSDLDGAEDLMDALDEAYTSWMRDFRLGKTRILVPRELLDMNAPGQGAAFNADREIFTELGQTVGSLNMATTQGNAQSFIQTFQPTIRDQEHERTVTHLLERTYAACGFSAQTFGEAGDVAVTATEITAREKLTLLTRSAKLLVARPVLVNLFAALLDVDEHVFAGPGRDGILPDVEFPDAVGENPQVLATTLNLLNQSQSASIQTRVEMLHPDWDDQQVVDEVQRIRDDDSMLPDPTEPHLWAAVSEEGSATGGVPANSSGVNATPQQIATVAKAQKQTASQENRLNGD